jgi:lipoyl(octanoyl) transferase
MNEKIHFLCSMNCSGAFHMGVDQYFWNLLENGLLDYGVLRFYTWKPFCFSLGKHQVAEKELNLEKIRSHGYDVVSRMTGGRVVFHANELTYSIVLPIKENHFSSSLSETYTMINIALRDGFEKLGISLDLEKKDAKNILSKSEVNKPCFASTSRSELVFSGKKVVGSAQRRGRRALIQHGSILIGKKHLDAVEFLNLSEKQLYLQSLNDNSISLDEINPLPELDLTIKTLVDSFGKTLNFSIEPIELSKLDLVSINQLKKAFKVI